MMAVRYLSVEELLVIHLVVIDKSGGAQGIRERGLLESLGLKPQTRFGGQALYPDLADIAIWIKKHSKQTMGYKTL